MSRLDDLKQLLRRKERRLQKLREQAAISGRKTDPEILLEIEDLEVELVELQSTLDTLTERPSAPETHDGSSQSPAGPWQVLVVDDEPTWQGRLKRILRSINCSVITASNYAEAEAELASSQLNLVTIDLNLDQSTDYADGLELVSQIRDKFGPNFPIIIITGQGDLSHQRRAFRKYHVFDFIEKARFDFEEFKETVLEAVNEGKF